MPEFVPGLLLGDQFYREAVRPVLEAAFPDLPHSAALIGTGSEVFGFDTAMSRDHCWGPRVILFLREEDDARRKEIDGALGAKLPRMFHGYPTDFAPPPADEPPPGAAARAVRMTTPAAFIRSHLGFDLSQAFAPADWLTFPEQKLRALTTGAVYHDGIGLEAVRARFAYYPTDVWLYLLAAGWTRIGQEQHLMGRAGSAGDELGSAIIASRLVRDVMRLCFLMERQYAPYPKWFGTAFRRLTCAGTLLPALTAAQTAATWQERERHLCAAFEQIAAMHNALGITEPVAAKIAPFHDRPFRVIDGDFAGALRARIQDPEVKAIAARRLIGGIDQISDNTDLLVDPAWRPALRGLYAPGTGEAP